MIRSGPWLRPELSVAPPASPTAPPELKKPGGSGEKQKTCWEPRDLLGNYDHIESY